MLQIVKNLMKSKTKIKILYKTKNWTKILEKYLRILKRFFLNFELN